MTFEGQYLSYEEYLDLIGDSGSSAIEETPFNLLEYNARMKIDERTFGRLKDLEQIPQEVKLCTYNLIETLKSYSSYNLSNKGISSESIDGYSVSYISANKSIEEAKNNELNDIINAYLCNVLVENVPVLYRGVK